MNLADQIPRHFFPISLVIREVNVIGKLFHLSKKMINEIAYSSSLDITIIIE